MCIYVRVSHISYIISYINAIRYRLTFGWFRNKYITRLYTVSSIYHPLLSCYLLRQGYFIKPDLIDRHNRDCYCIDHRSLLLLPYIDAASTGHMIYNTICLPEHPWGTLFQSGELIKNVKPTSIKYDSTRQSLSKRTLEGMNIRERQNIIHFSIYAMRKIKKWAINSVIYKWWCNCYKKQMFVFTASNYFKYKNLPK